VWLQLMDHHCIIKFIFVNSGIRAKYQVFFCLSGCHKPGNWLAFACIVDKVCKNKRIKQITFLYDFQIATAALTVYTA
jgi:hypothetical protein